MAKKQTPKRANGGAHPAEVEVSKWMPRLQELANALTTSSTAIAVVAIATLLVVVAIGRSDYLAAMLLGFGTIAILAIVAALVIEHRRLRALD